MVVEVLVAQNQAVDALPQDVPGGVDDAFEAPVVADGVGRRLGQPHPPVRLRQQYRAAVRGHLGARELGLDAAPFRA